MAGGVCVCVYVVVMSSSSSSCPPARPHARICPSLPAGRAPGACGPLLVLVVVPHEEEEEVMGGHGCVGCCLGAGWRVRRLAAAAGGHKGAKRAAMIDAEHWISAAVAKTGSPCKAKE
jgi:hypothetical protein